MKTFALILDPALARVAYPLLAMLLAITCASAQTDSSSIEKLRTESGVDPTRINSRIGFSALYYDKANNAASVNSKFSAVIGVDRWSFSLKPEIISQHDGTSGTGFSTAFSDLKFSILNAFYVEGRHAFAGSVEFSLPFGERGYGSQMFTATPAVTYSFAMSPSLIVAVQPQYTFDIARDVAAPGVSIFTTRVFVALFTTTGMFYVVEPRTIIDISSNTVDVIISPIIGKSLGAGFNLIGLMEVPTKQSTRETRGVLFQIGFNKNF